MMKLTNFILLAEYVVVALICGFAVWLVWVR